MDDAAATREEIAEDCAKFLDNVDVSDMWKFQHSWADKPELRQAAEYALSFATELMRYEFIHKPKPDVVG